MERLINAFLNSVRAFKRLSKTETAFQQELILLAVSLPLGWFVSTTWSGYALLVGSVLFVIIVEVLNTGIEAACDALSREFHSEIQLAKDCGSLAVLLSILMLVVVWGLAFVERIWGISI
jgi:diacylglycerol kinase (ATP)